jgi:hypothetical protein
MTDDLIYESPRRFEVWGWGAGHRGLLLRSNPAEDAATRIEVLFKPGYGAAIPSLLHGLQVSRASGTPSGEFQRVLGRPAEQWEELFIVRSGAATGWILAGGVHGREDDHEFHEPTMFDGWEGRPDVRTLFSVRSN